MPAVSRVAVVVAENESPKVIDPGPLIKRQVLISVMDGSPSSNTTPLRFMISFTLPVRSLPAVTWGAIFGEEPIPLYIEN